MKSRKKARKVTTLFHKYTRQREQAVDKQEIQRLDKLIEDMGGRAEYQRASQVSTSFHSTSKWVLGTLSRNGWLAGVPLVDNETDAVKKKPRRATRLLEVGAINTELLDAAAATTTYGEKAERKYRLDVRAIDLHAMHDGIEEADFLKLAVPKSTVDRYDVVVCSMVLNCVTTPEQRGDMLTRLYHFMRPGGLCFLTIPVSCLTLSSHMDRSRFQELLETVGLKVEQTKESPKISFFVCRKANAKSFTASLDARWGKPTILHRGKKYRTEFAVTLNREQLEGLTIDQV